MHGAQNTGLNACTLSAKKYICARACAHMQRRRSFFAMKLLRTYLESCVGIVQAVVCRPPSCQLDEINRPTLFAQEIRPNPCWRMTRSPLRCRTSIIRSSALVRTSSSLSMVYTRAWPRSSPLKSSIFAMVIAGFFQLSSDCCLILASFFFGYWNDPCNCHHFSPCMSPMDARVVQILP